MNPSPNLFLVGPMGAGKTTIGRCLAEHFALPFVDLDQTIVERTGAPITLIFELEGETGFREREAAALRQCSARDGIVLACGGGIVLRAANRALLAREGFVVYLEASVDDQLRRLARDRKRPLLHTGDREQRLRSLAQAREPWYRGVADLTIAPRSEPVKRAGARVAEQVAAAWQRPVANAAK